MTLRTRVLLAQLPLVLALVFTAGAGYKVAQLVAVEASSSTAGRLEQLALPVAAVAVVLGVLASARLTQRTLRPLSVLRQATRRIGLGDLEARAQVHGSDEVAELARDFNVMAARLAELIRGAAGDLLRVQQAARATLDSLPDPVLIFDREGVLREGNAAAATLLGQRPGESLAEAFGRVDVELRQTCERLRAHVLSGRGPYLPRGFSEALRLPAAEADRYWLPRALPLAGEAGEAGEVLGASVVLQDVTRSRRVEQLREDVVATAAHELKTPLTSLRMAVHLCLEEAAGPLTATQSDLLHAARQDCERIQSLIDDVLDLARIQAGRVELKREPLLAEALIQSVVEAHEALAAERGVELRSEVLPGGPAVLGDRERLELVLANLVTNALRHTPSAGRIMVRGFGEGSSLRFEVEDTGEGIPREYQTRVFDRFFRVPGRPGTGSGLGLAIAREIVEAHDGAIGVVSTPGEGSRFWFSLPCRENA